VKFEIRSPSKAAGIYSRQGCWRACRRPAPQGLTPRALAKRSPSTAQAGPLEKEHFMNKWPGASWAATSPRRP